jgi:hypothetical protein
MCRRPLFLRNGPRLADCHPRTTCPERSRMGNLLLFLLRPLPRRSCHHTRSGGCGNVSLCSRNVRINFLFIFLFVPYSFFAGTSRTSGLPRESGSPIPATGTGSAGLDFKRCCSNSKDDDVLPGKRWAWMHRWKQWCLLLLLMLCLAISAQALPDPQCDPCKPSCQPGSDKDLFAPPCEDVLQETLLYKRTVVILYSSGVPIMVCLLMAWTFWKAPRD